MHHQPRKALHVSLQVYRNRDAGVCVYLETVEILSCVHFFHVFLFKNLKYVCAGTHVHPTMHVCGGSETTFGSGSLLPWALWIKLKFLLLHSKCFYLLSHHVSLLFSCFEKHISNLLYSPS